MSFGVQPQVETSSADLNQHFTAVEQASRDLALALKQMRSLRLLEKDSVANAPKIRTVLPALRKTAAKLPSELRASVEAFAGNIQAQLEEHQERAAGNFAVELAALFQQRGVKLEGHLPLLEASFFTFEVRADDVQVWFGPQRESLGSVAKSAEAVAKFYDRTLASLSSAPFDSDEFLRQLLVAYRAALAMLLQASSARQARIDDVHRQMMLQKQERTFSHRQQLRAYTRVQFAFDLYRLQHRRWRNVELNLIGASRAQTVNKLDSLWVPSDASGHGGLYAYVSFREN